MTLSTPSLVSILLDCHPPHLVSLPRGVTDAHREDSVCEVGVSEDLLDSVHGRNLLRGAVHQIVGKLDHGHLETFRVHTRVYQELSYRQLWSRLSADDVILESKKQSVFRSNRAKEEPREFFLEFLRFKRFLGQSYK